MKTKKRVKKRKIISGFIACILLLLTIVKPIIAATSEVNIVSSYSKFVKTDEVKIDGTTEYIVIYKTGSYYCALRNNGGYIGTKDITAFLMDDGTLRVKDKDLYSWKFESVDGYDTYGFMTSLNDGKVVKIDKSTGLMTADKDATSWSCLINVEKTDNGFKIKTRNAEQTTASTNYCYLKFSTDNGKFVAGMGTDETASYKYDEFMIYEMVSETRPVIEPSNSIRETYNVGEDIYKAYSDKGTSDIEGNISTVPGKVEVDKSVAYKEDVYDSGFTYVDGEFSVVLSALSDQYIKKKDPVPDLDVVFILDVSGSMQFYSRMSKTIDALNESIKGIIKQNPNNKVGIATFSSIRNDGTGADNGVHGVELLPLSVYDTVNLTFTGNDNLGNNESATAGCSISVEGVDGTNTVTNTTNVYGATYTQYGIYQAYEMIKSVSDKEGRIPIVILLTDGEPTVYTDSYTDVGNENATVIGALDDSHSYTSALHGYYTVLSASYYKEEIAKMYTDSSGQALSRDDARFYSIGIDLDNNTGNTSCAHFRNMIVSPSVASLDAVLSCKHERHDEYYTELCTLLKDNPSLWYEYCDEKQNLTNLTLRDDMEAFIKMMIAKEESYIIDPLEAGTYVTFTDNIGVGMEIKEAPVLRYDGINYTVSNTTVNGDTTTYIYSGSVTATSKTGSEAVELSAMEISLTTNLDGTTTVEWKVPVELVPLILRCSETEIVYDMAPMRLIMRVGPNDYGDSLLATGIPIYTNQWTTGTEANVSYTPATDNGYYTDTYQASSNKDEMVSKTATTYYLAKTDSGNVTVLLGNNGKLVNISKYTLPVAGGAGTGIYYFVGLMMIIICLSYIFLHNNSRAFYCGGKRNE